MRDNVWIVVVARVGAGAKSRLAGVLGPQARERLALAMLGDVIETCATAHLGGMVAVVDTPAAGEVARRSGARIVADPGTGDMNAAVAAGVQAALARAATTVIILPGDVPLIRAADLHAMLGAAGAAPRAVILGAARDGQGTNALLLRPPRVIQPRFGPPSLEHHRQAGLGVGADTQVIANLGLAHDVDTPADLAMLDAPGLGRHTAAALAALAATIRAT